MGEVPTLVKILAIFGYIGSGMTILGGLLLLFGGFLFSTILSLIIPASVLNVFNFTVFSILVIAFGVLGIFIERGLWKGKNWARILTIVFGSIGIIVSLISIATGNFMNLINLIVEGAIVGYLLFNKKVKEAFKKA